MNTNLTSIGYSLDNGDNWTIARLDSSGQTITTPTVNQGDTVLWKGEGSSFSVDLNSNARFSSTGEFNIYGNIMSLLYDGNFANQTTFPSGSLYAFRKVFYGCNKLISAEHLVLPATTLTEYCYNAMLYGCGGLTKAPELPATTLAQQCYGSMFSGCTSLTTAPELAATTLTASCYGQMFKGCSRLNYIRMLATDISASNCLYNWVQNVAATGTFTKAASMTTLPTGDNGIPSGWTVLNEL